MIVLENMLAIYADSKQIALHRLSSGQTAMAINPQHYKSIMENQRFETDNMLLRHTALIDVTVHPADLSVYDAIIGGTGSWKN